MTYRILILVCVGPNDFVWKPMKPSGVNSVPYEFSTYDDASRVFRMCYPLEVMGRRVKIEESL